MNAITDNRYLLSLANNGNTGMVIAYSRGYLKAGAYYPSYGRLTTAGPVEMKAGTWYHIMFSHSADSSDILYVNGAEVFRNKLDGRAMVRYQETLSLGLQNSGQTAPGIYDEVRVSLTARSKEYAQLQSLFGPSAYALTVGTLESAPSV